jgi:catechol 2,3-dioxygenase-like lactoylglutathione lyase family enzyme
MPHLDITQQITFFYTNDLIKTANFCEDILGLELIVDQGSCRIYSVTSDGWIGYCERSDEFSKPKGVIFTLVTPDVDGWYQLLIKFGVHIEHPPVINEKYHIYHFFFCDPNGYLIEVQRFLHDR